MGSKVNIEEKHTSKTKMQKPQGLPPVFWFIRHGERYDEMPGNDWHDICQGRWFDPPLTERGGKQACQVGQYLLNQDIKFSAIYVSPLLRTMQTAAPIGKALKLPLTPVIGISQCAAAVEYLGVHKVEFLTIDELSQHCPNIEIKKFDTTNERFHQACRRLSVRHMNTQQQQHVIVVTHREGIKDIMQLAGIKRPKRIPYCGLSKFQFINNDIEEVWSPWEENLLRPGTATTTTTTSSSDLSSKIPISTLTSGNQVTTSVMTSESMSSV